MAFVEEHNTHFEATPVAVHSSPILRGAPMNRIVVALILGLATASLAKAQGHMVGKSTPDQWSQVSTDKRLSWRQLAITSTDGKSEMVIEFYSELGGIGMTLTFFDRPAHACRRATLQAIRNTSLLLDGKALPGARADSFTAGCAYEQWVERTVLGSADANVAIVQAFLDAKQGTVRLSSADGSFDHQFAVKGFRVLEHGDLTAYRRSKAHQSAKSMER